MTPWGLVNCKVFGPQGPSLTNRVSELFTHGSVGGVGRKPDPYPAPNERPSRQFQIRAPREAAHR
jgi:hypothetical protein